MKNPIIGYIVITNRESKPLELCDHPDYPHKILLRGDDVTVFKTRKAAGSAIQETIKWAETYREEFGDKWVESHRYSICRLRGEGNK